MIRAAVVVSCLGFLIGLAVKHDAATEIKPAPVCTHGESSVTAWVGKDGRIHQSKPAVTGCRP